jgi:hypothetical protein
MFPSDPHSIRQLHAADMHVAHQRRTRGKVVAPPERRWHQALRARLARLTPNFARPVTTAHARAERRRMHATASFTLTDAGTGRRLDD